MQSLERVAALKKFPSINFQPDFFQKSIEKNLYLEFFFSHTRALICPDFKVLPLNSLGLEEKKEIAKLVDKSQERIRDLKKQVIYQLSLYSSLLETNSYYICLNNYLVICRFVPINNEDTEYEIELYTSSSTELLGDYKEKLFLGRDLLSLKAIPRDYFGLQNIVNFLSEQIKKLERDCRDILAPNKFKEIKQEYLNEIEELYADLSAEMEYLREHFPPRINQGKLALYQILELNRHFREIKHILIDISTTVLELERILFRSKEKKAVPYLTKFHKDLNNYVNYITFKVNGRISDALNGFHIFETPPKIN